MAARFLLLMLCLVAIVFGSQATAQGATEQQELRFIMTAWSTPEKCNAGNAIGVRMRHAIARQSEFLGKCIKIKGFYSHRALFTDIEDIEAPYSRTNRGVNSRRIGVLARQEYLDELHDNDPPEKIEIIGIFTTCEQTASNMGGFFMGSYCHYTRGPIILVASYSR